MDTEFLAVLSGGWHKNFGSEVLGTCFRGLSLHGLIGVPVHEWILALLGISWEAEL